MFTIWDVVFHKNIIVLVNGFVIRVWVQHDHIHVVYGSMLSVGCDWDCKDEDKQKIFFQIHNIYTQIKLVLLLIRTGLKKFKDKGYCFLKSWMRNYLYDKNNQSIGSFIAYNQSNK